jgi:hypothetical protein
MQASYGLPADRARELAIAGTPAQVTGQLALYLEAGAPLVAVICDPVPSAEARELLACVRCLLNQPQAPPAGSTADPPTSERACRHFQRLPGCAQNNPIWTVTWARPWMARDMQNGGSVRVPSDLNSYLA